MSVGERIREMRESRALSQRALAKLSGVAQNTICAVELGKRPAYPSTLNKLARGLGVSPGSLTAPDDWVEVEMTQGEAGHTPSPWQAREADYVGDIAITRENDNGTLAVSLRRSGNAETNARLIAAAPELLEALRNLTEALEAHEFQSDMPEGEFHRLVDAGLDAIDKAEGR